MEIFLLSCLSLPKKIFQKKYQQGQKTEKEHEEEERKG
jgi:hypothetical protein